MIYFLAGIDISNYLIKRVVKQLQAEFPSMTMFSSLSPIPRFRDWLLTEINLELNDHSKPSLLSESTRSALSQLLGCPVSRYLHLLAVYTIYSL